MLYAVINLSHSTGSVLQRPVHEPDPGILVVGEMSLDEPEDFLWPVKDSDQLIKVGFVSGFMVLIQNRTGQGKLTEGAVGHGIHWTIVFTESGADHRDDIPGQGDFLRQEIQGLAEKVSIL